MSSNRQDNLNLIHKKRPRIFVGFDLDYTIFNPSQGVVTWIGGNQYWLNRVAELNKHAADNNVELILGFITKKREVDDIVEEAAKTFCELLKNQNPYMIKRYDDQDYVLVNVNNLLSYEIISAHYDLQKKVTVDPGAFTSFEVISLGSKLIAFDRILSAYGIPSELAMMVDDTPEVLAEFKQRGTQTVSAEYFHNYPFNPAKQAQRKQQLEDANYVKHHLSILGSELINRVKKLISKAKNAHEKSQYSASLFSSQAVSAHTNMAPMNRDAPASSSAAKNSANQEKSEPLQSSTLFNSRLRDKNYFVNKEPKTFTEGLADYFRCILG